MQDASVWETVFAILLPIGVALVAAVIIPAIIIAIALRVQNKRDAANPPTGAGADERAVGAGGDASDSAADDGTPSADNAAPPAIPPSSVPTLNELAAGSEIPPRADHEDREGPGDDGARTDAAKIDAPTVVLSNPLPPAPPTVAQAADEPADEPADAWTAVEEIDAPEPQPAEESGTQLLFPPIDAQPTVPSEDDWIMPPAPAVITTVDHGTRAGVDALGPGATSVMPERRPVAVQEASTAGPAFALDTLECSGLTLAFASIRGLGHEDFGRPRQDYAAIAQEGRYLIAAMADGVSEARFSHVGASVACRAAMAAVQGQLERQVPLDDIDWRGVTEEVRTMLRRRARVMLGRDDEADTDDRECALLLGTTAEVLVVDAEASEPEFVRATLAGDGYAFVLDTERGLRPLGSTKSEDEAGLLSSEVTPLPAQPGEGYPIVSRGTLHRETQAVLVTTDGIGDDMADGDSPIAGYLWERLRRPVPPYELLRVVSYLRRQSNDDRTAMLLWA